MSVNRPIGISEKKRLQAFKTRGGSRAVFMERKGGLVEMWHEKEGIEQRVHLHEPNGKHATDSDLDIIEEWGGTECGIYNDWDFK